MERLVYTGEASNGVEYRVYRGHRKNHFFARFFLENFEFASNASIGSSIAEASVNAHRKAALLTEEDLLSSLKEELDSRIAKRDEAIENARLAEVAANEIAAIFHDRTRGDE